MMVANDRPGLSPANTRRVSDPSFSTARDRGGTGLARPSCESLLADADGTLELAWPRGHRLPDGPADTAKTITAGSAVGAPEALTSGSDLTLLNER